MPIIEIEVVAGGAADIDADLACRTANALGSALNMAPGKVWVRMRVLPKALYAESGSEPRHTPEPVFVRVLRSRVATGEDLEREVLTVTRTVAHCLGRPEEHVHVEYAPPGAGRIAFGGKLSR